MGQPGERMMMTRATGSEEERDGAAGSKDARDGVAGSGEGKDEGTREDDDDWGGWE